MRKNDWKYPSVTDILKIIIISTKRFREYMNLRRR